MREPTRQQRYAATTFARYPLGEAGAAHGRQTRNRRPHRPSGPGGGTSSDETYLERRTLRRGSAGWLLLTGLGVAYVVSGDFSGWNIGLAQGGFGGLAIAAVLMGLMYTCLVFALAELAAILPTAGGGYGFARRALGTWGGFLTGTAILIEYVLAPAAISIFIGDYVESLGLFGLHSGWPVYLACFAIFIGIHLWGVGEALRFSLIVTAIAVAALLVFAIGASPTSTSTRSTTSPSTARRLRVELLAAVRHPGHLGGVPVRHVVLPRRRGRTAGGRGDQGPGALDAARPWPISMGILLLLAADHLLRRDRRARLGRRSRTAGNPLVEALQGDGEPTTAEPLRQLRGARRAWSPPSSP